MNFSCIDNLSSSEVREFVPWEFAPRVPKFSSKPAYKAWLAQPSTVHLLYSGFIGVNASLRVHRTANPIHSMRAIVADYDANISVEDLESMLGRAEAVPNYVHKTPSGGARLVWLLDRPVLITSDEVLAKALGYAAKSMDLRGLLPGFDFQDAFLNPTIYYDVGKEWSEIENTKPIKASLIEGWMIKASRGVTWKGYEVPIADIAKKVEEDFPGRWEGPFEEGARGIRFWDPLSDNQSAAIVRSTGMQCFTGASGFVTWDKIFSSQFIEQYTVERLATVIDGVWYDGKMYWYKSADGQWESRPEREMVRWLKVQHSVSGDKENRAIYSDIDRALHDIDQQRRVVGAAPFIYMPSGMLEFMKKRVLNTAKVRPLLPAEGAYDWGENFPWLAQFLEVFFDSEEQLLRFICWLKRFYCSAVEGKPTQGQAIFIAGEPGQGKTLLTNRIISSLAGGHQDAAQFLLGASSFNKELFHHGLWTVDDATPGDSSSDHRKFSSLLKKVTANTTFEYHAKFQDSVMVEWTGRVVITGNIDAESLRILPDLDTSILDKLMLFKASTVDKKFPDRHELQGTITTELPFLASFLMNFEIPAECISRDKRYGVKCYHHPELSHAAGETTDAALLEEVIQMFIVERRRNKEPLPWIGTATGLMQEIFLDDSLRNIVGRNSAKWFAINLGKLEARGRGVFSERLGSKKIYTIYELESTPHK